MGNCQQGSVVFTHTLYVHTGDIKGAGTDANVIVVLQDDQGNKSAPTKLDHIPRNDLERGSVNKFNTTVNPALGKIQQIELTMDAKGVAPDWFVDLIRVKDHRVNPPETYAFPIHRWIRPKCHYTFDIYDCMLPQCDKNIEQRKKELEEKKKTYAFRPEKIGSPIQVKDLPAEEEFSRSYMWDLVSRGAKIKVESGLTKIATLFDKWESYEDLKQLYSGPFAIGKPDEEMKNWQDDEWFGAQRLAGVNPLLITLCTNIPERFGMTEEMVEPFLEGYSLTQAMESKRLFIVDLKILEDIPHRPEAEVCSPLALFFQKGNGSLVPVAIQLYQEKGPNNPVFLPSDHPETWLFAKMWYNNADATYHQSVSHLGFTHLLIEGFALASHRNLSTSHPVFRLLGPHFLDVMAINKLAVNFLVEPGGWVDKTMSCGRDGMLQLIWKEFANWRLDVNGTLPNFLKERGLLDEEVLPNYYYREDALPLYWIIKKYVSTIINHHYETPQKLADDYELKDWRQELELEQEKGGMGVKGIPGDGVFSSNEELIVTCTSVIFISSVVHASVNFGQFASYGFPPNYPAYLNGMPPTDKNPVSESDIMKALPDKSQTLEIMVITKLLSEKGTNSLGDFEVQYLFDPVSVEAADTFRLELAELGKQIAEKNKSRFPSYLYLDPTFIPNSISI
ncbi:allene oxide synthase-lipoxygenase protein [Lingula anatina]|uniref:Allene oxide synthase-lipoxygenase protein n=1 Tax=Lingula anatina TaxID=7574 RepID=A0A1S3IQM5_LINAN|nr:allene oxide synthase-lipoxygenase protein [Lingula anatina]|eukprot:XP_013400520.1 allene oxide synthase-lipoxygenase protein [Lingula anatina]